MPLTSRSSPFNVVYLTEQSSDPNTIANQGALYTKDVAGSTELFLRKDSNGAVVQLTGAGSFIDAQYVVMSATGALANERVLTGTSNQITVTDGGAGGNVTLSVPTDFSGPYRIAFGSTATFGAVSTTTKLWHFSETITDFSAAQSWDCLKNSVTIDPTVDLTGGNAKYVYGYEGGIAVKSGNSKNIEFVQGMNASSLHSGTGTVNYLTAGVFSATLNSTGGIGNFLGGLQGSALNSGTGVTVPSAYGGYFDSGVSVVGSTNTVNRGIWIGTPGHTGTLTLNQGLYLDDQSFGTTAYSIYSAGGDVEISSATGKTSRLMLSSADVSQPATSVLPANVFGAFSPISGTQGGLTIVGLSDTDARPFELNAIFGTNNPTDATPAVNIIAAKSDGATGITSLGAAETVFKISNNSTSLVTVLGDGSTGWGTTTPSSQIHIVGTLNTTPFINLSPSSVTGVGPMMSGDFGTYGGSSVLAYNFTGVLASGIEAKLTNTSVSATASAGTRLRLSAAAGAGDAMVSYEIGATTIITGIDNSDSDKYKIGVGSIFGISDTLTVDTANVRVGINNASPSTALDVTGAITATSYNNKLSAFNATTSSELAGVISDETGSGSLVFATSPTLVTPTLGVASATSINFGGGALSDYIPPTTFTPTVTLVGGAGNTTPQYVTNSARYTQIGKRVFVDILLSGDGGNEGAGTGQVNVALPVTASASAVGGRNVGGYYINGGTTVMLGVTVSASATTVSLTVGQGTTAMTGADQNSTTRVISLRFDYEV